MKVSRALIGARANVRSTARSRSWDQGRNGTATAPKLIAMRTPVNTIRFVIASSLVKRPTFALPGFPPRVCDAHHILRLFRSALDALKVVESLKTRGVKLHLLDLGGDIAGNGLSKLFLTIAAAFAEAERDRIRERSGSGWATTANSSRMRPTIAKIIAMQVDGKPLRAIAAIITSKGHPISHEGVAGVLKATGG